MTWHQWQAEYPTDRKTGTSRFRASANASSDQGHHATGFSACCNKYGLVELPRRFTRTMIPQAQAARKGRCPTEVVPSLNNRLQDHPRQPLLIPVR